MASLQTIDSKLTESNKKLDAILSAIQNGMGANGGNGSNGGGVSDEDKKIKERNQKISGITDFITSTIEGVVGIIYKNMSIQLEKQKISMAAATDIFKKQMEAFGTASSTIISSITDLDAKNVVSNSVKRLSTVLDASTNLLKNKLDQDLIYFKRDADLKEQALEEEKLYAQGVGMLGGALKQIKGPIGVIAGGIADVAQSIWQTDIEYRAKVIEVSKFEQEKITDIAGTGVQNVTDYAKGYIDTFNQQINDILKIEDESFSLGRIFGYTGDNLSNFSDGIFKTNITMAELGKNWEDFLKIQHSYMDTTGRSIQLTGAEGLNISALAQWTGISDEESARLAGNMQIFNKGAMESTQSIFEMSQTAQSMGLSNQKFVKDLEKNLRLAQKYDFKNGTRGLQEMALFAQRTRMDMSQLDAILSGFHTGNIEDVITKAASLNVLGGNAALISDPLGMLYDAYANPKGMGERVLQSISGMGFFNQRTGETEFGIAERMRIEQIAKSLGMSPENLTEMARQENKGRELNRLYGEKAFGKYGERVKQQAYFENGEWKVNVMGEGGKTQAMSLSAIQGNASLLEKIMPDTEQGQLLEITKSSLSTQQIISGTVNEINAKIEDRGHTDVLTKQRTEMVDAIKGRGEAFINEMVDGMQKANQSAINIKAMFSKSEVNVQAIEAALHFAELSSEAMLKLADDPTWKKYVELLYNAKTLEDVSKGSMGIGSNIIKGFNTETELDILKRIRRSGGSEISKDGNKITFIDSKGKKRYIYNPTMFPGETYNPDNPLKAFRNSGLYTSKDRVIDIEDGVIKPDGKIIRPNTHDWIAAFQKGGEFQREFNGSKTENDSNLRSINITGEVLLRSENGQSVDVVKMINDDRDNFYRVATNILFPNQGQSRVNV